MNREAPAESVWAGALGVWLALALLKLGNPVILDAQVPAPSTLDEVLVASWPMRWGYILTCVALLAGIRRFRWPRGMPLWLMIAPLVWLGWQSLSAMNGLGALTDPHERRALVGTWAHFATCAVAFYYGAGAATGLQRRGPLWIGLAGGFLVALAVGWRQHFGGLEETRQFFFSQPDWRRYPAEFIQKISSDRIYSTLFYPNALAGVILLLLPVSLAQVWAMFVKRYRTPHPGPLPAEGRGRQAWLCAVGSLCITTAAVACLYWSGSKAGWLILLAQCLVAVLWAPLRLQTKSIILVAMLILGVAGFGLRYQGYFAKGATSVVARLDYWRVAWQGLAEKPLLGSGPGTFAATYKRLKPPEAEMTRLVHNDLLQQGTDSGWIGMLSYLVWFYGGVAFLGWELFLPQRRKSADWMRFGIWLGLFGIMVQSVVEFWLYIPALAWPAFFLLGFLGPAPSVSRGNHVDKSLGLP